MEDILCTAHISLQGTTAHVKVMPLKLVPLIRGICEGKFGWLSGFPV